MFLKTLIIACVVSTIPPDAYAQSIPLEPNAISGNSVASASELRGLVNPLVGLIHIRGYRCDSISSIRRKIWSGSFKVICNRFRYSYDLTDKGGVWTVTAN